MTRKLWIIHPDKHESDHQFIKNIFAILQNRHVRASLIRIYNDANFVTVVLTRFIFFGNHWKIHFPVLSFSTAFFENVKDQLCSCCTNTLAIFTFTSSVSITVTRQFSKLRKYLCSRSSFRRQKALWTLLFGNCSLNSLIFCRLSVIGLELIPPICPPRLCHMSRVIRSDDRPLCSATERRKPDEYELNKIIINLTTVDVPGSEHKWVHWKRRSIFEQFSDLKNAKDSIFEYGNH